MSSIIYQRLYTAESVADASTSTSVNLRKADSYEVVGGFSSGSGYAEIQVSMDNSTWYSSGQQVILTAAAGKFFGQFSNDNDYVRLLWSEDGSGSFGGVNCYISARIG